jgi:hypothetical protein
MLGLTDHIFVYGYPAFKAWQTSRTSFNTISQMEMEMEYIEK